MNCPSCAEEAPDGAKWCEACGHDLATEPRPTCVSCGEREVADDGYCLSCGHKQPAERDHMELRHGPVVAVTDRGRRHRHNEDAVAIGATESGAAVLVVCDGVSSTPGSAEASLRAAGAARDLLVAGLDGQDAAAVDTESLLRLAVEAAQHEASASTDQEPSTSQIDGGPPSSTFVAVVVSPTVEAIELATAWVGDSRAYWIGNGSARRLSTTDHELAGSLVRWLGADSIDPTPDIETVTVSGHGHVLVCSDGLWRYADEPGELADLLKRLVGDGRQGLALASALVDFANEQGGHDNITVALWSDDQPGSVPDATPQPPEPPTP